MERSVKRVFLILITPILGLFLLVLSLKYYIFPKTESFLIHKIQSYSEQKFPILIQIEKIRIDFLEPSIFFEKIKLTPKSQFQEFSNGITLKSLEAEFDFIGLLFGRLHLNGLLIDELKGEINLDPFLSKKSESSELPIEEIFRVLEHIPIHQISIKNSSYLIKCKNNNIDSSLDNISIEVKNEKNKVGLKFKSSNIRFQIKNINENKGIKNGIVQQANSSINIFGDFQSQFLMTPKNLKIENFQLRIDDGFIKLKAKIDHVNRLLIEPQGSVSLESKVPLGSVYSKLNPFFKKMKWPEISGEVVSKGEISFKGLQNSVGKMSILTSKIMIDQFKIGDASLNGTLKENRLELSEILINHPSGSAQLKESRISIDQSLNFSTHVNFKKISLQKLLLSIKLKGVPADVDLAGNLKCQGQILKSFHSVCQADVDGQSLHVQSTDVVKPSTIVFIDQIRAKGEVSIDTHSVKYKANVYLHNDSGQTDGEIVYSEGFHINYKTDHLDLKNISNISNLNLRGETSLQGFTEGDSNHGIFNIQIKSKDFGINVFNLGHLNTYLSYKSGSLSLDDISGSMTESNYNGSLKIDLTEEKISGRIHFPRLNINDVASALDGLIHVPVQIQGNGNGSLEFTGPLDFWKLNYKIRSKFHNGSIGTERFDDLVCDITGDNGRMNMDNVLLKYGNSTLLTQGEVSSDKVINLNLTGNLWRLEESVLVQKFSSNVLGVLNFNAEVSGAIDQPTLQANGLVKETVIDEQEISDSFFKLQLNRDKLEGQVAIFDKKLEGHFSIPISEKTSEFVMNGVVNHFPFTQVLAVFGGNGMINEYDSDFSAVFDLKSKLGDIRNLSGNVKVDTLNLRRRNQFIQNTKPIEIKLVNGSMNLKNFILEGSGNSVQLSTMSTVDNHNKIKLVAETEGRLWHLLVPFLEDVSGKINIITEMDFLPSGLQLLGTATLNSGSAKLKGIPHPFEKLQGEFNFSHSRANISSLKGSFAGGKVTANGNIEFQGFQKIPMNIDLILSDMSLHLPDKVKTLGSAQLSIKGSWFPYFLSGTYKVDSGLVEKEFTDDSGSNQMVKRSVFLPKAIKEKEFQPILLDILVSMDKSVSIKNSQIDGSFLGTVQVKGVPTDPVILGKVQLDKKSRLLFKDKIFEIQNGVVTFDNPDEVSPDLYITAQSRVQDYDINMLIQGNTKKNLNIKLTSLPPLPEKDIVSLLALGVTTTTMDQKSLSQSQATQTGVEVGAALLKSIKLDRKVQETTGWDLKVTSVTTSDSTKSISVPKAVATKKVSDKVGASVSLGADQSKELKLQYFFNNNLSTIGSYEEQGVQDGANSISVDRRSRGVFGLDLEFKKEFK